MALDSRALRPNAPRFSLRLKLGALAVSLALVPLPAVGFLLLERAEDALEQQLRELQIAVADNVSASIERQLGAAIDGLDAIGRILTDPALPPEATIALALRTLEAERGLDHATLYDAAGARIDTMREAGVEVTAPPTIPATLRRRADAQGFALGDAGDGRVRVAVPLRAPHGEVTGYAASRVSLAGLQRRVETIASRTFAGLDDALTVIDAEGRVLAASDARAIGAERARHPLVAGLDDPRFEIAFAEQRVYDAPAPTVGTLVAVPSHRWAVIVQVPAAVAFAPIHRLRWVVLGTLAVVTLIALLAGLWVARSITAPIHALVGLAERLGRREFGGVVEVESRDELRTLGETLSAASRELAESERRIREEEAIRGDLGRYLPAALVERVVRREQDMGLGGVRRRITVLFADVVAFTPLTEKHDPELVVSLLNELFTILTEIVFRHGGTVDKFVGDSVMALFGAPEPSDDHAARALAAAEDMLRWLDTGNEGWRARHGITIRLAIGVHTGEATVGNVGSRTRMAYTAIGDVVNVAARLEAMARPQQILVTEATREAAGEGFEVIDAGEHEIAGRSGRMRLYEVRV